MYKTGSVRLDATADKVESAGRQEEIPQWSTGFKTRLPGVGRSCDKHFPTTSSICLWKDAPALTAECRATYQAGQIMARSGNGADIFPNSSGVQRTQPNAALERMNLIILKPQCSGTCTWIDADAAKSTD